MGWPATHAINPAIHAKLPYDPANDFAHLLPEEIRKFTQSIQDAEHLSFIQGGGHGGSHPHMVNEFLQALAANRDPGPNSVTSANWTCVGICAHQSALKGGEIVKLPGFTLS